MRNKRKVKHNSRYERGAEEQRFMARARHLWLRFCGYSQKGYFQAISLPLSNQRARKRERERQRERDREKERQIYIYREREIEIERDREIDIYIERQREIERDRRRSLPATKIFPLVAKKQFNSLFYRCKKRKS